MDWMDQTEYVPIGIDAMLSDIRTIWKDNVLQASSVGECLSSVQNDSGYQPVRDFLDSLHTDMGLDMDVLWAIFMQWTLERDSNGNDIDRHSIRLLNAALSSVSQADKHAVMARCEAWMNE